MADGADNKGYTIKQSRRPRGEECYNAKLNAEAVKKIRENRTGMTDKQLAEVYGVHKNTIARVRNRDAWWHV